MDTIKHGFKNYVYPIKTVDSDSKKWAQIQYKTYRLIDFSELKSSALADFSKLKSLKTIELLHFSLLKSRALVDFSLLKSDKHIESMNFSKLKSCKSIKLPGFSALKSRASVDFSTVSLYQTKVQLPTGLWHFTTLKSHAPVGFQGLPASAHAIAPYGACIRAGELEAGSWEASWKLEAASWRASGSRAGDGTERAASRATKNLTKLGFGS